MFSDLVTKPCSTAKNSDFCLSGVKKEALWCCWTNSCFRATKNTEREGQGGRLEIQHPRSVHLFCWSPVLVSSQSFLKPKPCTPILNANWWFELSRSNLPPLLTWAGHYFNYHNKFSPPWDTWLQYLNLAFINIIKTFDLTFELIYGIIMQLLAAIG